jgi:hypothetical protein
VSTDRGEVLTTNDHGDELETVGGALEALTGTGFQPGILVGRRYRIVSLLGRDAIG